MSVQLESIRQAPSLQQRIADAEGKVRQVEATIARLSTDGHVVADAGEHLRGLRITLAQLQASRETV